MRAPTQVYVNAHSYERKKVGLEEVAFATLDFPDDIIASVISSWIHHVSRQRTVIIVSKKNTIKMEAVEQTIIARASLEALVYRVIEN